ncbi:MAG: MarC family protein [Paludibacter sp.]|nr:MarC family protein [Bacteroidales bacterium]MCM1069692.1 MarC family protein [Prevotella sp.]MCM1354400.1 MarC family protein [Bacteroides sp.]MCM1441947.1 MarC family protein [Muribaculum sp.]MCM1482621.1 MarC family protein [Paludibacter sp.]
MPMNFDFLQIVSAFIVLFAIIDPLGSIPIILNLESKGEKINALRTSAVAMAVMFLFLFVGEWILKLFNVDINSFAVAGAIIIFIMALEMVCDIEIFKNNGPEGASAIVPLAFPLFAGPGSFTALLSLRAEYAILNICIALVLNMLFVYLVLRSTRYIQRLFGEGGIYIIRKFFGIVLLAIAVKLFTSNIAGLIQ